MGIGNVIRPTMALAVGLVALMGASALPIVAADKSQPMPAGAYRVISVHGKDIATGAQILQFGPEGRLTGFGGCNRLIARYEDGKAGALGIRGVGRTRKLCPEPQMGMEDALVAALEAVSGYLTKPDGQLVLTSKDTSVIVLEPQK